MEKAVDNLESMFQKAEADLNYLSRKLDFELEYGQGENSQAENNPVRLMKKIEEVKTEYSSLVQDMTAIQTAQKDAVDFFRSQLLTMTRVLENLETQSGQNPELAEATIAQFEELSQLMGIPKEDVLPTPSSDQADKELKTEPSPIPVAVPSSSSNNVSSSQSSSGHLKQPEEEACAPQQTPYERRANSSEFMPITEEEFLSVSELVRGRAKLEDVNRTYRMLWQHFKEENHEQALTPKEMNSMGLRVTGATGQAKLKILRGFKLCSMSKTGDVRLL